MHGHFYMAKVPENSISAKSGDDVAALQMDNKFQAVVAPFPLVASG